MPSQNPDAGSHRDAPGSDRKRRHTDLVLAHWQRSRRDGTRPPAIADLNLNSATELADKSFLLRADLTRADPVFILCGQAIIDTLQRKTNSRSLEAVLPRPIRRQLGEACQQAVEDGIAVRSDGSYQGDDGGEVRFRSVFLPARTSLGTDYGFVFGTFGQKHMSEAA